MRNKPFRFVCGDCEKPFRSWYWAVQHDRNKHGGIGVSIKKYEELGL